MSELKIKDKNKKIIKLLTMALIISVVAIVITVIGVITVSAKNKQYYVTTKDYTYSAIEKDYDYRSKAELRAFAKRFVYMLNTFSYKDFKKDTIQDKKSNINNALSLTSPKLRKAVESMFYKVDKKNKKSMVDNIRDHRLKFGCSIKKVKVIRKKEPYEVAVKYRSFTKSSKIRNIKERAVKLKMISSRKTTKKVLGKYGLTVTGYRKLKRKNNNSKSNN